MDKAVEDLAFELAGCSGESDRRSVLNRSTQVINSQAVVQLDEAVRELVRVDVRKALLLADAAITIAESLGETEALALASRSKANALWFTGDCKSAVEFFRESGALFEAAGNMTEVARTLSSSIQSFALLGEYELAFAAAARARQIFTDFKETLRNARLDINVANIYHRQNRYLEALAVYERAYEELLPHRDIEAIGVALHNMAVCFIAIDDIKRAFETYQRVREFCQEHEMPLLVLQADYNVAYLHYLQGDYTKALDLLRTTRTLCVENGDTYHLGLCDLDQSEIYLELGLPDEAAEMAQRSFDHFERLGMAFESARSLTNLGIALSLQQDLNRALELFARAKDLLQNENNKVRPNIIDLYRALVLVDLGDLDEAKAICLSAAEFFRSVQMPGKQVFCLLILTRICLRAEEVEAALQHCADASLLLETLDEPILFYQAQFLQGKVYEASGRTQEAYDSYRRSQSALETLRSSLHREELKIGFMRNRLEVYSRLIQLCLTRDSGQESMEEAFSFVEAARSRTLRDLVLTGSPSSLEEGPSTATDRQLIDLRNELNRYYHRIENEQLSQEEFSPASVASLRAEARSCEQRLMRLLLEAPDSAGLSAALRSSKTASLEEIRSVLGPEAVLLEYFEVDGTVMAAVLARGSLQIVPLSLSEPMVQELRLLEYQLSKFHLDPEYVKRFYHALLKSTQAHLRRLYDLLIAPLESLLAGSDLVIVPFGPLHSLPFHALFDGRRYLVDRFSVCYQPSASILAYAHSKTVNVGGSSLILGVEDARTPYIREEVQAVASTAPDPFVLFGTEATEAALREHGSGSRLVHIASHGFFRQDNPMFSSIKLADTYLTLYDLYHMRLPVDLLTLSGCVTGLNVVSNGDELLGLTRGLLYAGARSLLLSLWDVDDRSTSQLMRSFYCGLQRTNSRKVDALKAAMLEVREQNPHPYYWAPFKLIGRALA